MSKLAIIALNLFLSALLFVSLELGWLAAINIILFLIWLWIKKLWKEVK